MEGLIFALWNLEIFANTRGQVRAPAASKYHDRVISHRILLSLALQIFCMIIITNLVCSQHHPPRELLRLRGDSNAFATQTSIFSLVSFFFPRCFISTSPF